MKLHTSEIRRYVINGLIATFVHYSVLTANMGYFEFKSAGLANLVASICGIASSFLGNRNFVFKSSKEDIFHQFIKFSSLYGVIALLHGLFLWIWTDMQGLDYRIGFIIVTGMQVFLGYLGNKFLIFKV